MYGHVYVNVISLLIITPQGKSQLTLPLGNCMDQPGKVANPARGQLNRENEYFPVRVRA